MSTGGPQKTIGIMDGIKPFCKAKIGSHDVEVLIDTGADVSVISEFFFKTIDSQQIGRLIKGNKFVNRGEAEIKFNLGDIPYKHKFQILKGLTKNDILGSDFLSKNQALIDFYQQTLRIGKQKKIVSKWVQRRRILITSNL